MAGSTACADGPCAIASSGYDVVKFTADSSLCAIANSGYDVVRITSDSSLGTNANSGYDGLDRSSSDRGLCAGANGGPCAITAAYDRVCATPGSRAGTASGTTSNGGVRSATTARRAANCIRAASTACHSSGSTPGQWHCCWWHATF
jgi:hypothetical protein